MIEAETIITIEGTKYALFQKSALRKYPHMVNTSTGEIPDGDQKSLLGRYLAQNGVNPLDLGANTHTLVRQAISIAQK